VGSGNVLGRERALGDVSVLATQVTCLAGLGLARVAGRSLAAEVRVQVSAGSSAVAISRDWLGVDVLGSQYIASCSPSMTLLTVHERAASLRKTCDRHSELDALAIGGGSALNGTSKSGAGLLRKSTSVLGADGVAGYLRSGSDGRGLCSDGSGRSQNGDD
jgi:hypothetical protein